LFGRKAFPVDHDATLDAPQARPSVLAVELAPGTVVGRFVVLGRLGAGGMGVVYAAYDPELDRKVAVKLLLPDAAGSDGQARMLREAQALAKLSHPHIVTIYDVGTHEGRVWLAMEFVDGLTLSDWLAQRPRAWPEVLGVISAAGRGVAAAHEAGLLHRDLKPDNIMISVDGRVRVMDFGLARTPKQQGGGASMALEDTGLQPKLEALALQMTQTGALIGTPAYMAPEQLLGQEVGPAADLFSLCVTLWEALYGARPFAGKNFVELSSAVFAGKPTAPRGARVPRWLRRVALRGLAVAPEARWPSIHALNTALARGRRGARWRRALAFLGVLGACAAGLWGWQAVDPRARVSACERAGAEIAEVWNDDAREALRAAIAGTGASYANVAAETVMPWLDDNAQAWQVARTEACLDAEVRGAWDADIFERGLWCLGERRMEFDALVAELSRGEPTSAERAVPAAAGLGQPGACLEEDVLTRLPAPPATRRDELRAVRAMLARATALQHMGDHHDGLEAAGEALSRAQALDWPPLVAAAHLRLGELYVGAGDPDAAVEAAEPAYFEAAKSGAWDVATAAADLLAYTVGGELGRYEDGLRWSRHAEVSLASLPDPAQLAAASHFNNLARIHWGAGEYQQAEALHERVLAIREQALGLDHLAVAQSLNNLANVEIAMGAYEQAQAHYERALAIFERAFGREHPSIGAAYNNLATLHRRMGADEEAKTLHERALAIRERALGPDHPQVAQSLTNLANVHRAMGAYDAAKPLYERALAIREQALGPDHPQVARVLSNLARAHRGIDGFDEAKALYHRALAIREAALGPHHPDVAITLSALAELHLATGAYEDAEALHERALAIQESVHGLEHPHLAYELIGLARIALAKQEPDRAVGLAARALGLHEAGEARQDDIAAAQFVLARALWDANRDRDRAVHLAKQARDALAGTSDAVKVQVWLEARKPSR
jgi:eukaryotic-like serine/threonine-protein kinase